MNIKSVNGNIPYFPKVDSTKKETKEVEKSGDKLEISQEALKVMENSSELNKTDLVKSRIKSKFYDSAEVINSVAEKILKEL